MSTVYPLPSQALPPPGAAATGRVLVVDDVPENLAQIAALLAAEGHTVRVANSGAAALRLAATDPPPELILLDVVMPGMDGFEVLARLRAEPRTAGITVLFLSARAGADDEAYGLAQGAADYIAKPIQPQRVLARVRQHLHARRHHESLHHRAEQLERSLRRRERAGHALQQAVWQVLAHQAGLRDPITHAHLQRSQVLMAVLARALSQDPGWPDPLDEAHQELLVRAAPLHDLGKLAIPEALLRKPGPLDRDEWALMRAHPVLGEQAVERVARDLPLPPDFVALARQVTRSHHERWDGSGYPDGLAGDAIPAAARVMAVVDVFDSLLASRHYKRAGSPAEARAAILAGAGRQFDPRVVAAFDRAFDELLARWQAPDGAEDPDDRG